MFQMLKGISRLLGMFSVKIITVIKIVLSTIKILQNFWGNYYLINLYLSSETQFRVVAILLVRKPGREN